MPYYEFYCPQNHRIYTFFARTLADAGKVPRCPDHPAWRLEKRVSRFAVVGRAKEPAAGGESDGVDDARLEAAMAEMEREAAGMDEDNPDPRQLARLMRRMGELTGEPMGEAMQEMIGRLEAGEDPEALEEQFGDALDDDPLGPGGGGGEGGEGEDAAAGGSRVARFLASRSRPPQRDARVFEMSDWT